VGRSGGRTKSYCDFCDGRPSRWKSTRLGMLECLAAAPLGRAQWPPVWALDEWNGLPELVFEVGRVGLEDCQRPYLHTPPTPHTPHLRKAALLLVCVLSA
jgi:hypothetical protein